MQRELDDVGGARELAAYRLGVAKEDLASAEKAFADKEYRTSNNRAYYAIFHAVSSCLALRRQGYRRHGQVIGYFNKEFVHTGVFPKEMGRKIMDAQIVRHESDYEDFYVISDEDALEQIKTARDVVARISEYVTEILTNSADVIVSDKDTSDMSF